jgi:hypothetical protein
MDIFRVTKRVYHSVSLTTTEGYTLAERKISGKGKILAKMQWKSSDVAQWQSTA